MAIVLNHDERMLCDTAAAFFRENSPVSAVRALRDAEDGKRYSPDLWTSMADMGFSGVIVPEVYGGAGFGYVGAGVIAEQIGRNLVASPFLSTAVLAAEAIKTAGSEAQKSEYLPRLVRGELIAAVAVDEAPRHDPGATTTRAAWTGNSWLLDGAKTFVIDGAAASLLVIPAISDKGLTLYLAPADAPGVMVTPLSVVDARNAADVVLEGVRLPADALLGVEGQGDAVLERVLDVGRAMLAAEMLGLSQEAFGRTVAYMKDRIQYGRTLAEFQALQHRAARLHCDLELGRGAVLRALRALDDQDPEASLLSSLAKAALSRTASLATREAIQLHGGIGVTDEFDIGFFFKRARVAIETFGDASYQLERLARLKWKL